MAFLILFYLFLSACSSNSDTEVNQEEFDLYFPPQASENWETTSAETLGWNTSEIENLLSF